MEVNEREILRLVSEINNIKATKLSEWFVKTKKHLPVYVAEYLFMKNTGIVSQMLTAESEDGLMYDPAVLRQGIDMLMSILESQNLGHDTARLKAMYTNFADTSTRVGYLKPIIDQLDIYPTIGDEFVLDIEGLKQIAQSAEEIEFYDNYIRNIQGRKEMQTAELNEKLAKQRQRI